MLNSLQEYVLTNFPTGLNWNVKGTADFNALLADLKSETSAATEKKADLPPPNKAALFAQLNQGANVTSGFIILRISLYYFVLNLHRLEKSYPRYEE